MRKFPTAPGGRVFLIVAIDYFTKWVEAEAVVKITEQVIKKFIWNVADLVCHGPSFLIMELNSHDLSCAPGAKKWGSNSVLLL